MGRQTIADLQRNVIAAATFANNATRLPPARVTNIRLAMDATAHLPATSPHFESVMEVLRVWLRAVDGISGGRSVNISVSDADRAALRSVISAYCQHAMTPRAGPLDDFHKQ